MTKIHVTRHKLEIDVKVDPSDAESLIYAANVLKNVAVHVAALDHATLKILDSRVIRVTAPEPKPEPEDRGVDPDLQEIADNLRDSALADPTDDNLDISASLGRTAQPVPEG